MERQPSFREGIDNKEYVPSDLALNNFLNLTPDLLETLRNRLENVQGHLRIWVHPLYTEQWPRSAQGRLGDAELKDIQKKLREAFFKTVASVVRNQNSSPLVVYETIKNVEQTKCLISEHLGCEPSDLEQLGVVFVPTEAGSALLDTQHLIEALEKGEPKDVKEADVMISFKESTDALISMYEAHRNATHNAIPGLKSDPSYLMSEEERELHSILLEQQLKEIEPVMQEYREVSENSRFTGNDFMVSLYESLGVKSTLISGAYLEVGENYKTKELELKACAGSVVNYLRDANLPTDISNNIWPPKELIKEAGFEVKQTGQVSDYD